jgi:hypothetical protein
MTTNIISNHSKRTIKLKSIALPNEHGSWGFLFEPLLAGLLIAPSFSALWISLLVIGAFLTRQPLKILLSDLIAKRRLQQTVDSFKFVMLFGVVFIIGLGGSLFSAQSSVFLPFLLVLPLGIFQIYCDVFKKSRQLIPEITGAIAISSTIAVTALAGGLSASIAYSLWIVFVARLIPSIHYVRNRLRLEKSKEFSKFNVIFSHIISLGIVILLSFNNLIPKLPLIMFIVLLIRAIWGLSPYRKKVKAMKIGIGEVIYGTLTAVSVVLGYYWKI